MKPFENIVKTSPTASNLFGNLKSLEMKMRYDTEKGSGFEISRDFASSRFGISGMKRSDQDARFGLVLSTSY